MAGLLNRYGVTSNDLSFFRERRAVGQRWIGLDYYPTCEHIVSRGGKQEDAPLGKAFGFRKLAADYYARYKVPLFHCETNRVSELAPAWLAQQWDDILALRAGGVPMMGFTWYSLTDQIDWQHALRVERNDLHPVGLYDLDRNIRPVGTAYREIVQRWMPVLNGGTQTEIAERATA
jgi:hypothetical protein